MVEQTVVLIKPDGIQRNLVGEIISRFERKGFKIRALKLMRWSKKTAEQFYSVHKGKPFFKPLIAFMTSGPVVAMVLEAENAIDIVRKLIGELDPKKGIPGTIRGDYALDIRCNIVHGSDSPASANREMKVLFKPQELIKYD
ncbi:MAG: nucleoside-diphosphate kinase [bacterium]|nr:nucleoside-diphosphate kinase [bacterium]